ncbi:hypothetical protein [Nonomuraea sp. NPDC050643]|uniref:hypothetical protein n=1 Tax=Nonomuraea sp. NPDC050643 TaxID=3155660 RepID=UPI0033C2F0A0
MPTGPTGLGTSAARLGFSPGTSPSRRAGPSPGAGPSPDAATSQPDDFLRFRQEVVRAGYPRRIAALTDGYRPSSDPARVRAEACSLRAELATFGIQRDLAYIECMCTYRQLMIPVDEADLGMALSRSILLPTIVDDSCDQGPEAAFRAVRAAMLKGVGRSRQARVILGSALHPQSVYTEHMFNEFSPFCSANFLGLYKTFYYQSLFGVILESAFTPDARDDVDTEYVRVRSGFGEYYATAMSVAYRCLSFDDNMPHWGATLGHWGNYVNDVNDLMSFYKEILGGEFTTSRIYRNAIQHGMSLTDSYEEVFQRAVAGFDRIRELGTSAQRPHLLHYLQGFVHWHLTSRRYRWAELIASS